MATVTFAGASSKTFTTDAEAEEYVRLICDAQEKRRCFEFTDDGGRDWVLLPSGAYLYIDPS